MTVAPRIYLSTGEASGDRHGAAVAAAIRQLMPGSVIEATGGPCLSAAGVSIRHSTANLAAFGAAEIVGSIPRHLRLLSDLRTQLRRGAYDLLVLVDYPGFHLRLAASAAQAGVPVLYYIAPQLWAWGAGRAAKVRQRVRQLAVILPFEEAFFHGLDIPATFVGHPLLDRTLPTRAEARARFGLSGNEPTLALFPGSREGEIHRLWPAFRDAAHRVVQSHPATRVLVAGVPGFDYPGADAFTVSRGDPSFVLRAADAGICKSGTTTLEAALGDLPMVVAYKLHPWSHAIARRVVRVSHVGLVNLVAGREVAPEFLQDAVTPAALADAVMPLLDPGSRQSGDQRAGFDEIRRRLGSPGAANRVAAMAQELVA